MNDISDSKQIDKLLAKPALISDRGFSERVSLRTRRLSNARRNLFLMTGLSWIALMLVATSPQTLYADLLILAQSMELGSFYSYIVNQIEHALTPPEQLPYTAFAVAILSLAAVVSMAIRA
ncbi:MAG: hypothetical protein WDZ52_10505 [Pseudohongiellaceae bacterium]